MLALAVLNCATTNRGANSKKFNFIFETKRWREGESPDEFVPTGDLGLFSTSSSPFFLSPTLRQFSTNGQTIKVVCTGKHTTSRGLDTYFHGSFIIRIYRSKRIFLSSDDRPSSEEKRRKQKRLDTDSYSRLRVFAYATGERLVGTRWWKVLEGARQET